MSEPPYYPQELLQPASGESKSMWYQNQIFIGCISITVITCTAIFFVPEIADEIVNTAIGAIAGFVSALALSKKE